MDSHEHDWVIHDQWHVIAYPTAHATIMALMSPLEKLADPPQTDRTRFLDDSALLQWPWLYDPTLPSGDLGRLPDNYVLSSVESAFECNNELPKKCSVRNNGVIVQIDTLMLVERTMTSVVTWTYNAASPERGLTSRKWKLTFHLEMNKWIFDEGISLPQS